MFIYLYIIYIYFQPSFISRNSHATKTPTFTPGSSRSVHLHDELANEADLLCTELSVGENAAEDSEIVERKENAGDPSNQEGNQRGSGEIVDESQQEDEEQERGAQMMEVEDVQNNLVKTSAPWIVVRMIISYSLFFPYGGDPRESNFASYYKRGHG